jgi:hypothetical protein
MSASRKPKGTTMPIAIAATLASTRATENTIPEIILLHSKKC